MFAVGLMIHGLTMMAAESLHRKTNSNEESLNEIAGSICHLKSIGWLCLLPIIKSKMFRSKYSNYKNFSYWMDFFNWREAFQNGFKKRKLIYDICDLWAYFILFNFDCCSHFYYRRHKQSRVGGFEDINLKGCKTHLSSRNRCLIRSKLPKHFRYLRNKKYFCWEKQLCFIFIIF